MQQKSLPDIWTGFNLTMLKYPYFFNATALVETQGEKIKDIMKTQMISPVYFNQIIDNQWEMGVRKWLELGPKGILCGLLRRILVDKKEQWDCESIDS